MVQESLPTCHRTRAPMRRRLLIFRSTRRQAITLISSRCMLSINTRDPQWGKSVEEPAAETRDWANLSEDVLLLIFHKLSFVDRCSVACACKGWLPVVRITPCYNGLPFGTPCLFLLEKEGRRCHLSDPLTGNKYTIDNPGLPSPVKILCSCKGGWVLMSAVKIKNVFFFNPLAKATITGLPKMPLAKICGVAVSHVPTSPDCVVIVIGALFSYSCYIYLCRRGAKNWDDEWTDYHHKFNLSHPSPIFHKEMFYCMGDNGRLAVFNHIEKTFTVMEKPEKSKSLSHRSYITELDGELIWVRTNLMGDSLHICKLDGLRNEWKYLDGGLGDSCLFVSKVASTCTKTKALEGRARNRVYFNMIHNKEFVFYSCEDHTLHPRPDFDDAKDFSYTSCWLDPVFTQPSAEELQWS